MRKEVQAHLAQPFEVCITPRQVQGYGFSREVYFAYILSRSGSVAVFESGPDGLQGWGYDDVVGLVPYTFQNPKAIQFDPQNDDASVCIAHEGPIDVGTGLPGLPGEGAVSRLRIETALVGPLLLQTSGSPTPIVRDMTFGVPLSVGANRLSGIPVDLAFDNQRNIAGLAAPQSAYSAGTALLANGNQLTRTVLAGGPVVRVSEPQFLFLSVPSASGGIGAIDVLSLAGSELPRVDTNLYEPGTQSIEASGVGALADYFRQ